MRSLQRRLPLYVLLLILAVVTGLTWLAYREQRVLLLSGAELHLQEAATQLKTSLEQSARMAARGTQELAAAPSLRAILAGATDTPTRNLARDTLRKAMSLSRQVSGFEIRDANGERVLVVGRTAADSQRIVATTQLKPADLVAGVGPFAGADTLLFYTVLNPIADSANPAGWLATHARVTNNESAKLLTRVMGQDVVFLLGSAASGVWTDLARVLPAPQAVGEQEDASFGDYRWQSPGLLRGVKQAVSGTAWEVWVAQSYSAVLAPARGFTRRMLILGGIVLVLGSLVAVVMSRRLTLPITQLTAAAEKLSNGQYTERVPVRGETEIADMGRSFNRMADRIEASTHELEDRVEARTAELKQALIELKAAQDQLVRKEKLAILGQLASGVGHELRNPLGVMLNATYYLGYVLKDAPPDVYEYLGILQGQIGLAEKIVSDLLDFSRVKPPQREEVKMQVLVEEQIARLGTLENIEIVREYDESQPTALIDRVQIGQIVFNLLTNGAQAMVNGGRLTVRTSTRDGLACVEVADSGDGIAPENLERIFEPLFTTKARGIGLGLAVSRSLAQANQGELSAHNGDHGAVFSLTLPGVPALVG